MADTPRTNALFDRIAAQWREHGRPERYEIDAEEWAAVKDEPRDAYIDLTKANGQRQYTADELARYDGCLFLYQGTVPVFLSGSAA